MEHIYDISVIIPVYNIEEYLEESLQCLFRQGDVRLQVIMIDDGSTDNSGEIAERYSREYEGFECYHVENGGSGRARNIGKTYAKGKYIAYLDSDDMFADGALEMMFKRAEADGSDLVVCNSCHFDSAGCFDSKLHKKVFRDFERFSHIRRNPNLIYDTTNWDKLIRRDFYERHDFKWPEGILYQDIPLAMQLHYYANQVSMIYDMGYYWRVREGETKSTTQNTTKIRNLRDRIKALDLVDEFFDECSAESSIREAKAFKAIGTDMLLFINKLHYMDRETAEEFAQKIREYLERAVDDKMYSRLRPIDRQKYRYLKAQDLDALIRLLNYEDYKKAAVTERDGRFYAELPKDIFGEEGGDCDITEELKNAEPKQRVKAVKMRGDLIEIDAQFYTERVNIRNAEEQQIRAFLYCDTTGAETELKCVPSDAQDLTEREKSKAEEGGIAGGAYYNYDGTGALISIDMSDASMLDKHIGRNFIFVEVENRLGRSRTALYPGAKVRGQYFGRTKISDDKAISIARILPGIMAVDICENPVLAGEVSAENDRLVIRLNAPVDGISVKDDDIYIQNDGIGSRNDDISVQSDGADTQKELSSEGLEIVQAEDGSFYLDRGSLGESAGYLCYTKKDGKNRGRVYSREKHERIVFSGEKGLVLSNIDGKGLRLLSESVFAAVSKVVVDGSSFDMETEIFTCDEEAVEANRAELFIRSAGSDTPKITDSDIIIIADSYIERAEDGSAKGRFDIDMGEAAGLQDMRSEIFVRLMEGDKEICRSKLFCPVPCNNKSIEYGDMTVKLRRNESLVLECIIKGEGAQANSGMTNREVSTDGIGKGMKKSRDIINDKTLSFLVRAHADRSSFKKEIKTTAANLAKFISEYPKAECVIVCDVEEDKGKAAKAIGKEIIDKKDVSFRFALAADIDAETLGEYIMLLEQGDELGIKAFRREIKRIEKAGYEISAFSPVKKNVKIEDAMCEDNHWSSIFVPPFDELTDPHGALIKRSIAGSLRDMTAGDYRSTEAILRAVMTAEGFLRIGDLRALKTNHPEAVDYKVDDDSIERLREESVKRFGRVEEYLQFMILSLLGRQTGSGSLDTIRRHIQHIDNKLIAVFDEQYLMRNIWLLGLKYGKEILKEANINDNGDIVFDDSHICELRRLRFSIEVTEIEKGVLTFEGRTDLHMLKDSYKVYLLSSEGERIPVELSNFPPYDVNDPEGGILYHGEVFKVSLPLKYGESFRFYLEEEGGKRFMLLPTFSTYSHFAFRIKKLTASIGGYNIRYQDGNFHVRKSTKRLRMADEIDYMKYLISVGRPLIAAYRILYYLDKFFSRKPVWIVADRPHIANDNGEHMFRYLQTTEAAKKNNIYFLIREDSQDYERLRKTGKVLKYGSHKHKIKFLRARVILCAAANDLAINAMGKSRKFYRDLYDYNFIYLRHGVSHNDQSSWIHKLRKNISLLVATCRPEYEGILNGYYGYTEKEVRLTGLPRYDNLYDESKKEILILPTWRKNLQGDVEYRSSERDYSVDFADSDYCKFYNGLINNERLLSVMEEYGYTGKFYLHPVFERQYKDFKSSSLIKVGKGVADYQELFRRSAIMVTDYSSVAFDFAYLKKPVIYSQFDEEDFYRHHAWGKGYFTYRRDAFGPITTTVEETVDELIYYIKNDCRMKDEYREKVENFFAYTDRNNCKRVYDAVMELENERR
ncbi:MAG: CDP-glycerol glycerophosphotransferase family protein [Mogibacterium sp.]|nr:CDP-glycerol glycerophosphotransferase family protein [Mogibacterium sp.]